MSRDLRKHYYNSLGVKVVDYGALEDMLKDREIDIAKLMAVVAQFGLNFKYRKHVWPLLLGALPPIRETWNFVLHTKEEEYRDILEFASVTGIFFVTQEESQAGCNILHASLALISLRSTDSESGMTAHPSASPWLLVPPAPLSPTLDGFRDVLQSEVVEMPCILLLLHALDENEVLAFWTYQRLRHFFFAPDTVLICDQYIGEVWNFLQKSSPTLCEHLQPYHSLVEDVLHLWLDSLFCAVFSEPEKLLDCCVAHGRKIIPVLTAILLMETLRSCDWRNSPEDCLRSVPRDLSLDLPIQRAREEIRRRQTPQSSGSSHPSPSSPVQVSATVSPPGHLILNSNSTQQQHPSSLSRAPRLGSAISSTPAAAVLTKPPLARSGSSSSHSGVTGTDTTTKASLL